MVSTLGLLSFGKYHRCACPPIFPSLGLGSHMGPRCFVVRVTHLGSDHMLTVLRGHF